MKKILLFVWICLAAACTQSDVDDDAAYSIILDDGKTTIEILAGWEAVEFNYTLSSSKPWSVSGDTEWCQLSQSQGDGGGGVKLVVSLLDNEAYGLRETTLVFTSGDKQAEIKVAQSEKSAIVITKSKLEVSAAEQQIELLLQSNEEFRVEPKDEWITHVGTRSLTDRTLVLHLDANNTEANRTGTVLIHGTQITQPINIVQAFAAVEFEDAALLAHVLSLYDSNNDGQLAYIEADAITSLELFTASTTDKIPIGVSSLAGIEQLSNLESLDCSHNPIAGELVVKSASLKRLVCGHTAITTINLTESPQLNALSCNNTALTALDLSSVTQLKELVCNSSAIQTLRVPASIETLNCTHNSLSTLELTGCAALCELYCGDNRISSLSIAGLTAVQIVACDNNAMTELTLGANSALKRLSCHSNQLSSLSLASAASLKELSCGFNRLSSIDVGSCGELKSLYCNNNTLSSLSLLTQPQLALMDCRSNQISQLNISGATALEYLNCSANGLSELSIENNPALEVMYCDAMPSLTRVVLYDECLPSEKHFYKDPKCVFTGGKLPTPVKLPYTLSFKHSTTTNGAVKYARLSFNPADYSGGYIATSAANGQYITSDDGSVRLTAHMLEGASSYNWMIGLFHNMGVHDDLRIGGVNTGKFTSGEKTYMLMEMPLETGLTAGDQLYFVMGMACTGGAFGEWRLSYSFDNETFVDIDQTLLVALASSGNANNYYFRRQFTLSEGINAGGVLYIKIKPENDRNVSGKDPVSGGAIRFVSSITLGRVEQQTTATTGDAVLFEPFDDCHGGVDYMLGDKLAGLANFCGDAFIKGEWEATNTYQRPLYAQIGYVDSNKKNTASLLNIVGELTTPALGRAGDFTLSFDAAAYRTAAFTSASVKDYGGDLSSSVIKIEGGGTINGQSQYTVSGLAYDNWNSFSVPIQDATAQTKLTFTSAPAASQFSRWFIDNIYIR